MNDKLTNVIGYAMLVLLFLAPLASMAALAGFLGFAWALILGAGIAYGAAHLFAGAGPSAATILMPIWAGQVIGLLIGTIINIVM